MKHRSFILSILALLLIACAVISPALAYFTDNAEANGRIPFQFGYKTEIQDSVKGWVKTVSIQNIAHPDPNDPEITSDPIWVRVRAFSGETYPLETTPSGGWVQSGDWWYYMSPLGPGESTAGIDFKLTNIPEKDAEDHEYVGFNVSVVYESILVRFDEDGNPDPSDPTTLDWTTTLDTSGTP